MLAPTPDRTVVALRFGEGDDELVGEDGGYVAGAHERVYAVGARAGAGKTPPNCSSYPPPKNACVGGYVDLISPLSMMSLLADRKASR